MKAWRKYNMAVASKFDGEGREARKIGRRQAKARYIHVNAIPSPLLIGLLRKVGLVAPL